ncbi:ABC transporter permease [Thalassobaculum sp. OXR-137]|uniref:ABC transporter permease n=1 Tax=Thalassobaculum sp. OXR-137 TaxID=3100173 RepID=UPI002AC8E871|nr:ABC transporter permease [Thalassobaculum sp. OXR-137]WPZ36359.1 ABC transporter permease [Thalassobaculum sp. OXR-137]
MIRLAPVLAVLVMIGPVAAGLVGTLLPALGWLPVLGGHRVSLDTFRALLAEPGLETSVWLSLSVGLGSTLAAFCLAVGFTAAAHGTRLFRAARRLISPLLSVPHVTLALGLAFLIAPSGWAARLLSPWATGWQRPPDLLIVQDPNGLSLALGLVLKETPFLFLMLLAALGGLPTDRILSATRTLGYRPMTGWLKAVLPQAYPRLRLPIFAVLAFATSTVDMAILLGPSTPAPLAVRVVQWMGDPDLARRFVGSAGAVLQAGIAAAAILLWIAGERLIAWAGGAWIRRGGRGRGDTAVRAAAMAAMTALGMLAVLALAALAVWAVAGPWRFPAALPATLSAEGWLRDGDALWAAAGTTATVALAATAIALVLVVGCLERETRTGSRPGRAVDWLLYAPLIVPQVAFLFGVQVLLVVARLDGSWLAVVWSHLVFVLPYVFLSLAGAWRRFDTRYIAVARSLGRSATAVLISVTLPMLARPVATAAAVGAAVSVALYLPTLFAGAGRIETLTTEAVARSASGDRRVIAAYGLLQICLPLAGFALAGLAARRFSRPR